MLLLLVVLQQLLPVLLRAKIFTKTADSLSSAEVSSRTNFPSLQQFRERGKRAIRGKVSQAGLGRRRFM